MAADVKNSLMLDQAIIAPNDTFARMCSIFFSASFYNRKHKHERFTNQSFGRSNLSPLINLFTFYNYIKLIILAVYGQIPKRQLREP